jgi:hypothetical protein
VSVVEIAALRMVPQVRGATLEVTANTTGFVLLWNDIGQALAGWRGNASLVERGSNAPPTGYADRP